MTVFMYKAFNIVFKDSCFLDIGKGMLVAPYFSGWAVYSVDANACPFINASYVTMSFSVSLRIVFTDSGVRT